MYFNPVSRQDGIPAEAIPGGGVEGADEDEEMVDDPSELFE